MALPREPRLAIVGATGAVGRELLTLIHERRFLHASLKLLASRRSVGSTIAHGGSDLPVDECTTEAFAGVDLALFSAGGSVSRSFGPIAADAGAVVVDNSSAFRMDPGVPLVVPEVNGSLLDPADPPRIIANPNCSTIILLVPLQPLRVGFGIERVIVSTYQAVSGAGAAAMAELDAQTRAVLDGSDPEPKLFSEPCAFNCFSHDSAVDDATGRNVEEQKMIDETRKIWGDPGVLVSPTCLRVPVRRAHTESVHVTLRRPASLGAVRACLADAPGVELLDDRPGNRFPTPLRASDRDPVLVGRVRPAATSPHEPDAEHTEWALLLSGDQIRKGAALNALQIAERLLPTSG